VATKLIDDDVTPSLLHQLFSYLFSAKLTENEKKKLIQKEKKAKVRKIDA